MEHLTFADLTADQFTALLQTVTHRVTIHCPDKWLWVDSSAKQPQLVVSTRFSDKRNPSGWAPYLTRLNLPSDVEVTSVSVLWIEKADWFLYEVTGVDAQGSLCHQFIKATVQGEKKYKTHALCLYRDRLTLQE
ncbi:hypothetical protein RAY_194 [Erwinia phage vB_EamM_RAY]|jgi:hypothetical protein|nr:hypothetical protein Ea357_192 [Erwinia phage Ea35-70]YP_009605343.1 hypothetical protein FDH97_gp200 [Erwinia phage vB_EamM_Deimos-Minion]YP_009605661.1 hypothetical protein FDH98_gp194 [Erwinia phage vB_EamM_RAY]YP_009605981.1 hypothetical protein FDH99_gp197 [Erwinia phage vB_EamM_Simmy50]YP_009606302.1 hypothetical protein FDI00_gp196 [Erwinia phage vB_EamM_Special G]YP_009621936.1 hypothetical protein FDJ23_gp195 [Erwinia phage vB_EamM_Desertfox]AUG85983.1 hypothetical protein BOSOLAP